MQALEATQQRLGLLDVGLERGAEEPSGRLKELNARLQAVSEMTGASDTSSRCVFRQPERRPLTCVVSGTSLVNSGLVMTSATRDARSSQSSSSPFLGTAANSSLRSPVAPARLRWRETSPAAAPIERGCSFLHAAGRG